MVAGGLAYRSAGDARERGRVALLVHGYPESSYMWRHALPAVAAAGWRALAPDLAGYGDSEPDRPGTWERHIEGLDRFVRELELGPVALVTHDWGVPIGLRWACDHPGSVRALVISDGGFFADRRWHDLANVMRTPGDGEKLVRGYTRERFGAVLGGFSSGITGEAVDEYWKAFADDGRRLAQLDLYRSGEFAKLEPYRGRVAALAVPVLILWGAQDRFAAVKMARRFHDELPDSELEIFEQSGHFIWEDEPDRAAARLTEFLERRVEIAARAAS
jgi:haloalkane dehalogenase